MDSLARLPDARSIILEVFDRMLAVAPAGATDTELLERLGQFVPRRGLAPPLQQVSELAAQHAVPEPTPASISSSADDYCLQVVIRQEYDDRARFSLSLTPYRNGKPDQPQEHEGPFASIKEIKARLRVLLPAVLSNSRGLPLIEFAVPEKLLDAEFDQWPMPSRPDAPRAEDYRLGEKYPVVVRDLERMKPGKVSGADRDMWESRWKLLLACDAPVPEVLRLVDMDKGPTFRSMRASLWHPDAAASAMLALLPARASGSGKAVLEALRAGFTAGMPAAIWLRPRGARKATAAGPDTEGAHDDDRTYLHEAVFDADPHHPRLRDLPRRIWSLRLRAEADQCQASYPGRRLSLLWADPSRCWNPTLFRQPPPSSIGDD